jgi:plasmid stabilization system protein ParE
MKHKLDFTPRARRDQAKIAIYLLQVSGDPRLHPRWLQASDAEADYAIEYPTQTPPILGMPIRPEGPLRRRIITGFKNYLLFYRLDGKAVTVTRILHGSRDLRRVPDL